MVRFASDPVKGGTQNQEANFTVAHSRIEMSDQYHDQSGRSTMTEDEVVDQASIDSFPASDAPPFWARDKRY